MENYKIEQISTYWRKRVNIERGCPKCKIGTLIYFGSIMCANCGKSPVKWLILKDKII